MNKIERVDLENAIQVLLDHSNIMSPSDKLSEVFNDLIRKQHRTIQQSFIKSIHDFLVEYSDSSYDLRNETSVLFAKDVKSQEQYFPFI